MKQLAIAFVLLLAWGAVKIPWESDMTQRVNVIRYGNFAPLAGELRLQLGQGFALAALGGFRGLAANFIWMKVTDAWENTQWTRLRSEVEMAVLLQPRVEFFWDLGAWHLAWNASIAAENFDDEKNPLRREITSKNWVEAGKELLERGTRAIPESADLFVRLGDLYWQRLHDYRAAAECYKRAAKRPDALPFTERFVGIALEKAGDTQAAHDYYVQLYNERNDSNLIHPRFPLRDEMLQALIKKYETRNSER